MRFASSIGLVHTKFSANHDPSDNFQIEENRHFQNGARVSFYAKASRYLPARLKYDRSKAVIQAGTLTWAEVLV